MSASVINHRLIELQQGNRPLSELRRDLGQVRSEIERIETWIADAAANATKGGPTFQEHRAAELAELKKEYGPKLRDLRNEIATLERKEREIVSDLERQADHENKVDQQRRDRAVKLENDLQLPTLRLLSRAAELRVQIADCQYADTLDCWSVPVWARPDAEKLETELATIEAQIAALAVPA